MEDSPGKKNGCPVQYSFLENSLGREVWQATDHRFKRATQSLSNTHIHAHTHTHTHTYRGFNSQCYTLFLLQQW